MGRKHRWKSEHPLALNFMKTILKHMAIFAALLVPAAALAQETSVSGIKVDKYSTFENGMGEITIEAFATGLKVKTVTETHIPADIVLVLDVSGSMSGKITFNGKTEVTSGELSPNTSYKVVIDGKEYYLRGFKSSGTINEYKAVDGEWTYDKVKSGTYYYKDGNNYYEVSADYESSGMGMSKKYSYMLYYYKSSRSGYQKVYLNGTGTSSNKKTVNSKTTTIYSGNLYTKEKKTSDIYTYRYSTKDIKSSGSGNEFYTGSSNFSIGDTASVSNYQIFSTSSSSTTKIDALQTSVSEFISQIAADSKAYGVDHRISIVKFGASSTNTIGNDRFGTNDYNYTQVINDFLSAKDNESSLKSTIGALAPGGGTRASDGMKHAKDVITGNSSRGFKGSDAYYKSKGIDTYSKVVVMFTDGEPGDYGFNTKYLGKSDYSNGWYVANNTIANSKALKDAGVTVYTIGVISDPGDDVKHYLDLVSSDYPTAEKGFKISNFSTSRITTYPKEDDGFYQMSTGADLSDIFQSIANESSTGGAIKSELNESTVLKDIINPDFNLPEGATVEDIRIYVSKCTGCTPNAEYPDDADMADYTFSSQLCQVFGKGTGSIVTPDPASPGFGNVKATVDKKDGTDHISISGFSYKDYWCGNENNNGTRTLHAGYKLIVKIPFTITNCHEDRSAYETNGAESGLYSDSGVTKIIGLPIPNLYGIIIMKNGLLPGESAIFNVYAKENGAWASTPCYTTMIVGDGNPDTADVQVIAAMADGEYKVVEDMGWSWTYTNERPSVEHMLSESDCVLFTFSNSKITAEEDDSLSQNAEATVTNEMGTDGSQSASSN